MADSATTGEGEEKGLGAHRLRVRKKSRRYCKYRETLVEEAKNHVVCGTNTSESPICSRAAASKHPAALSIFRVRLKFDPNPLDLLGPSRHY